MTYARMILGTLLGLFAISFIVESIDFIIVKTLSGLSLDQLKSDPDTYFAIRNQPGIFAAKLVYTFIAALAGAWICAVIAGKKANVAAITLVTLQTASLIWAGFFSTWSSSAPPWLWLCIIGVTGAGIFAGYRMSSAAGSTKQ